MADPKPSPDEGLTGFAGEIAASLEASSAEERARLEEAVRLDREYGSANSPEEQARLDELNRLGCASR